MGAFAAPYAGGQLNVAASSIAKRYKNNALVGDLIAPRVPMPRQTFQYLVHDRASQYVPGSGLRAPGGTPRTLRSNFSTAPYFCQSHAWSVEVPYETEQYALGFGFSQIESGTNQTMDVLMLEREQYLASLLLNPANTPNTTALANANMWDSYLSGGVSQPIQNVEAAKALIRQSGVQANLLVISDPTFVALQSNPQIIGRTTYKSNEPPAITLDTLSAIFNIKTVLASAVQLDKNFNPTFVWGQSAILCYAQEVSDQSDLSAAKTFVWAGAEGTVDGYGVLVEPKYPLSAKATLVSTDWYWDIRITAPETLFTFTNTCAAPLYAAIAPPAPNY